MQKPARKKSDNSSSSSSNSKSRSREKPTQNNSERPQAYIRRMNFYNDATHKPASSLQENQIETEEEKQKKDIKKELLRSFLRIEQLREEPIDKFVKIVWILKGKFIYDHRIHDIMADPKKYVEKLPIQELAKMLNLAEGHRLYEHFQNSAFEEYWSNLIGLVRYLLQRTNEGGEKIESEYQQRIKQVIMKPLPELIKLEKQTIMILKTQTFGSNTDYWKQVLVRIKARRMELVLQKFYLKFKEENADKIIETNQDIEEEIYKEPTSPTLVPFSSVNPKLIVEEEVERQNLRKTAQKIFKVEFERGRERLEINLSLPHNHNLLNSEIVTEQTNTYDQITKQIIEFEKYKRMEEDEEDFNQWVPCETEGRFRQSKPVYINRVRVSCEWNKYNSMHYTEDNPPPKTIQGYKFNIFYPDLHDKQKTPQYYLQNTDDPNYCIIKFKAGPPYKDIAFKILKKEWDFTEKSGFQSIFVKGILHLYFNFKKPRFRI